MTDMSTVERTLSVIRLNRVTRGWSWRRLFSPQTLIIAVVVAFVAYLAMVPLAYLLWGTGNWAPTRSTNEERVEAVVAAYRKHVELTDEELDRLEGVMYIRPLYLVCFGYRRDLTNGVPFDEWWFLEPAEYFTTTAEAARKAFRR